MTWKVLETAIVLGAAATIVGLRLIDTKTHPIGGYGVYVLLFIFMLNQIIEAWRR